ncbi:MULTISPECIES: DoxX family protein [Cellulophaga]|uniref:DoxX family protein n=1 Tax=Cellulophaga TaxID=104264 RepID=UPI000421CDA9|nr:MULTISPECIES: DoxX family protein [Cellulophaga]KGK32022.1 DoxX family protein [Cellulophaga sp. E6(2014)]MCR1023546.1 DoxX family protein [Cellulophaga baltica]WFO14677.1 DoxX family protein [Cellulophaga baltica 4]
MKEYRLGYVLARIAIGVSMFGHGLVRLPKLEGFKNFMVQNFENSMVPEFLVTPFAYTLPILEFMVGILLIIGLFTRQALVLGAILMIMLVFGSTMIENWGIIDSQLIHAFIFIGLLLGINYNYWSLDTKVNK